jgi:molybdopterin converting factor small subunit
VSIKVYLHKTHRRYTGDLEMIEVEGETIGACLKAIVARFPEMQPALFQANDAGKLQKNIEIYLNLESAYPDELARPTKDGDQIHITVMLAGG